MERLALYEPPYNGDASEQDRWQDYDRELTTLLAEGRHDEAVALFMRFFGAPPEMIEQMRESQAWPTLVAVAPALAYDNAAIGPDRQVPTDRARQLTIPTLVMNGSLTLPFIQDAATALAAALPEGRHLILEGQRHDVSPTSWPLSGGTSSPSDPPAGGIVRSPSVRMHGRKVATSVRQLKPFERSMRRSRRPGPAVARDVSEGDGLRAER